MSNSEIIFNICEALGEAARAANRTYGYENYRTRKGYSWSIEEGRDHTGRFYTKVTKREGLKTKEETRYYSSYYRMRKAFDSWKSPAY